MARQKTLRLAVAMAAVVACGGSGTSDGYSTGPSSGNPPQTTPTTPVAPPAPNTVMIANTAFNPTAVTVTHGTTVTWKWAACTSGGGDGYGGYGSDSCPTHNVTFDDGSNIASQTLDSGEYTRTFASPGTYKYHCSIHGASVMSGQVVVQ